MPANLSHFGLNADDVPAAGPSTRARSPSKHSVRKVPEGKPALVPWNEPIDVQL